MRSRVRWILAALPLLSLAAAGRASPQDSGGVRTQVDEIFKAFTRATPGCAVGADVKGQAVVRAAYGMANLEHDVPLTVDTISSPGSVAKQFTAAAVLLLERDGKLSLDDPAHKYLPELPSAVAAVTIRQMLNHTATHTLSDAEAARLTGLYRSKEPVGSFTIVFAQGRLQVPAVASLIPQSPTRFVTSDLFTHEFDGRGGLRTTDEFGRVILYDRVEPVQPSAAALRAFTGRYTSDEVNSTLDLLVDAGALVVRRPPDWNIRPTPVYADAFSGDLGWITFERDASGRVIRLNVSQDRMWRLPFVRAE